MKIKSSFQAAVARYGRMSSKREEKERQRKAAEKKAESDAIARRHAPFQAAAACLQALMRHDPDFAKYMRANVFNHQKDRLNSVATTTFGQHREQVGWVFDMTPTYKDADTKWDIVIELSKKGSVELKVHNHPQPDFFFLSPADIPQQVWSAFQTVLETLQDKAKVYNFLLQRFGAPKK